MHRLYKLLSMDSEDRRLLLRAAVLLAAVRAALWTLPFGSFRRLLLRNTGAPRLHRAAAGVPLHRISWAVTVASRWVPRATCLTQAVTTQMLLSHAGYASNLCVGVARREQEGISAHAWVESAGQVVIGGGGLERYARLPTVELWP